MSTAALADTTRELARAAEQAERRFLEAGQGLERAVEILARLTPQFDALHASLTQGGLRETGTGLSAVVAQAAALVGMRVTDDAALATLSSMTLAIHPRITALLAITREVDVLAMNAHLAAAGMGAVGLDFLVFAAEIRRSGALARGSLEHVSAELTQTDQHLRAARDGAAAFLRRHGETMRAIPDRLAASLRAIALQRRLAGDAAAAVRTHSRATGQRVAEQIVALQLGDITRQRIEHVQSAADLLTPMASPSAVAWRLLAAQLRDAADTLDREGTAIEAGLRQLTISAREIGHQGATLHAAADQQGGSFIARLEADLRQTRTLFEEVRSADTEANRSMSAVLDAAGRLVARLDAVRSVEADIRIMGLNTTLKCGRLGMLGRPLAVIAQALRECGGRTAGQTDAVNRELVALTGLAARLADPARAAQHVAMDAAAATMLAAVENLAALEHTLVAALARLQADAEEVERLVVAAVAQFCGRRDLSAAMRQAAAVFAATSDPSDDALAGEAKADQAILQRIAASYTMARERDVHACFTGAPQVAQVAAAELEDVLF